MLSIIIINYHSAGLILNCLDSIYRNTDSLLFELIVVNNNGTTEEGDKRQVLNAFPRVVWQDMPYNAGFARANNAGIQIAKGDAVLLLNPDTLVNDNVLATAYHRLMASACVACGVQLLNEDLTPQISGNYAMKGGLNYLLPLPYFGDFMKWLGETVHVKKPSDKNITSNQKVDWINGAFLMVKKAVIAQAGLLDNDFFLYAEEAEWCSRLKKQGDLIIYGDLHIVHLQGETANESFQSEGKGYYNLYDRKGRQIMVSNFVRIRKEFGLGWFCVMLFLYTMEIPVFLVGGGLSVLFKGAEGKAWKQKWTGYCRNVLYLYQLSGKIIRNQPYFYKVL